MPHYDDHVLGMLEDKGGMMFLSLMVSYMTGWLD